MSLRPLILIEIHRDSFNLNDMKKGEKHPILSISKQARSFCHLHTFGTRIANIKAVEGAFPGTLSPVRQLTANHKPDN